MLSLQTEKDVNLERKKIFQYLHWKLPYTRLEKSLLES